MAKKEKKGKGGGKKPGMGFRVKLVFAMVLLMAAVFLPSTVVFGALMMPTFVALLIDRSPQKSIGMTVGALNFAGIVPAWLELWAGGHTLKKAMAVATDPTMLLIAYVAAGIGWVIYANITPFVAAIVVRKTEKRVRDIDQKQKKLVARWGDGVKGALGQDIA